MTGKGTFLEKIYIENFLSLHKVELPLKPLTIIVGPNASGKSNILKALELLQTMMSSDELPPVNYIQNLLWIGGADKMSLHVVTTFEHQPSAYRLELQPVPENRVAIEKLLIGNVEVISVTDGTGWVVDEDGENRMPFNSKKLALRSAGDYGNKPITNALTNFIRAWEFYDIRPNTIRGESDVTFVIGDTLIAQQESTHGAFVKHYLMDWYTHDRKRFQAVHEAMTSCSGLGIDQKSNGEEELYLLEGYKEPIPLSRASDGTLRLLAYNVLLNSPELPPLIAIEEPERNLHPAVLKNIGGLLEQLAERTQVIITTHSSQLLDTFNIEKLSESLGILLLHNKPGYGTEVMPLDKIR